jgi:heme A synthase
MEDNAGILVAIAVIVLIFFIIKNKKSKSATATRVQTAHVEYYSSGQLAFFSFALVALLGAYALFGAPVIGNLFCDPSNATDNKLIISILSGVAATVIIAFAVVPAKIRRMDKPPISTPVGALMAILLIVSMVQTYSALGNC